MNHANGLSNDRRGGIEGLPMELLIIIVVATIGVGIVVGWMNSVESQEPSTFGDVGSETTMIATDGEKYGLDGGAVEEESFAIRVYVHDSRGNGIEDAVVMLSGMNVSGTRTYGQTDSDGNITFDGLKLKTYSHTGSGNLTVSVSATGFGETSFQIKVVKI